MKSRYRSSCRFTIVATALAFQFSSCTDIQPPFECAARNAEVYQVRFIPMGLSSCPLDGGYITNNLTVTTAGMETYVFISLDGGGGPDVQFESVQGNLDRSATKLGLRLGNLLHAVEGGNCVNEQVYNCSAPDFDFGCRYCVTMVGDGSPGGTSFKLPDGSNAKDETPQPPGPPQGPGGPPQPQGVYKPTSTGQKRISLSNFCVPGVRRTSTESPDPNLFLRLPRFGVREVCSQLQSGLVTSQTVYPEVKCNNGTTLEKITVTTALTEFKLVASAQNQGTFAKGILTFEERRGSSGSCSTTYKALFMTPSVKCMTDLDCSPVPVPWASRCTNPMPSSDEQCYSGANSVPGSPITGTSDVAGSGLNPSLFGRFLDGGYDVRDTCYSPNPMNPMEKVCIWEADAGI